MSTWRNDMKCKYMFLFPLKNLACKELRSPAAVTCFYNIVSPYKQYGLCSECTPGNARFRKKKHVWADNVAHCIRMYSSSVVMTTPLQCRQNERDGVSNHRRLDCLLNCLFKCRSKKASKLRVTGLCEGNWAVDSPSQRDRKVGIVSIWWRHHAGET